MDHHEGSGASDVSGRNAWIFRGPAGRLTDAYRVNVAGRVKADRKGNATGTLLLASPVMTSIKDQDTDGGHEGAGRWGHPWGPGRWGRKGLPRVVHRADGS